MVELEVCERAGIPHSQFLSWSKDDRDKAVAYRLRQRAECPSCGTRPDEWDESRGGDLRAYVAEERRCLGCEQREAKRASIPPDAGRGIHIVLRPNRG